MFPYERKELFCFFFFKEEQKKIATKKPKYPFESLDSFASGLAVVFKLHEVLLFLLLIENIGNVLQPAPSLWGGGVGP